MHFVYRLFLFQHLTLLNEVCFKHIGTNNNLNKKL